MCAKAYVGAESVEQVKRRIERTAFQLNYKYAEQKLVGPGKRLDILGTRRGDGYTIWHSKVNIEPHESGYMVCLEDLPGEIWLNKQMRLRKKEVQKFLQKLSDG